ncbi:diguanylate cyclase [Alteromonas sp. 5E99-2]|uniref:diguanylate cyclase domain-containing protein n=1 Tax=Alteromonas sp. 5E99-2 TaxID=2817683 RepID=UPI001A98A50A|nr:diguanylate cyclase [Alteromonas sp. 5E99-2]MBO1255897.1 diguanylate cyclase [Alteromonas sp. 5E99-2]
MKNTIIENTFSLDSLPSHIFKYSSDGVMLTDNKSNILDINTKFEAITGYSKADVIGRNPNLLSSGIHDKSFYDKMSLSLKESGNWTGDIWNKHKNGEVYLENLSITVIYDEDHRPMFYLAIIRDITAQRLLRNKLEYDSLYDSLTHLPNRRLLAETLKKSMQQTKQQENKLCVFYLDLDGFKKINDELGHYVGDKVLVEVSKIYSLCIGNNGIVSRIGGDEFAGIIFNNESGLCCFTILNNILDLVSKIKKINEYDIVLSASIGITFWSRNNEINHETLLQQADFAMYQAKRNGKNRFEIFDKNQQNQPC